jgi:hypothetical protein
MFFYCLIGLILIFHASATRHDYGVNTAWWCSSDGLFQGDCVAQERMLSCLPSSNHVDWFIYFCNELDSHTLCILETPDVHCTLRVKFCMDAHTSIIEIWICISSMILIYISMTNFISHELDLIHPGSLLLIRLKRIYNFWCSMLCFTPFAYCFVTLSGIFIRFPELTY